MYSAGSPSTNAAKAPMSSTAITCETVSGEKNKRVYLIPLPFIAVLSSKDKMALRNILVRAAEALKSGVSEK
jgi:hypothetical protein